MANCSAPIDYAPGIALSSVVVSSTIWLAILITVIGRYVNMKDAKDMAMWTAGFFVIMAPVALTIAGLALVAPCWTAIQGQLMISGTVLSAVPLVLWGVMFVAKLTGCIEMMPEEKEEAALNKRSA